MRLQTETGPSSSTRTRGFRVLGMHLGAMVLLAACVTINVYFPAAEAKEAAKQFVEKVIGDEAQPAQPAPEQAPPPAPNDGGMAAWRHFDPLMLVGISPAYAQSAPDITIKTPAIQAIQARMEARFDTQLRGGFDSGALGFTRDGLVVLRDPAQVALKDRVALNQAVADDNRDRKAVYREVAVANNHPEWEAQIRGVFAKQWIASAHKGWWYQDASGAWKQK